MDKLSEEPLDPILKKLAEGKKRGDEKRASDPKLVAEYISDALEQKKPKSKTTDQQQSFLFPDNYYGTQISAVPTEIAQSAVFRVSKTGTERTHFTKATTIAVMGDRRMMYTGPELDQADADVWLQAIKMVKGKPMGEAYGVEIKMNSFLHSIGRNSIGSSQYNWLKESLERLTQSKLYLENEETIGSEKFEASSYSLLDYDIKGDSLVLWIPERSYSLFKNLSYVDWERRFQLQKRVDLSKAIQLYASSNQRGRKRSVDLDDLRQVVGYSSPLHKFRVAVEDALAELERVGILENTWLKKDEMTGKWRCGWYLPDMKEDSL
ncbi:MAG: hypothetical protein B7X52_04220 [Thiotrichales bacterium 34-46-19]|nr:MAG: hypothetical protein B7X52_04220 [Thiotrichales bacterium 34-46-19]HQT04841.1 plasmid replication initiator TrfA [Thiotrichales bacterium]